MDDQKLESFSESLSHLKRLRRIHFNLDNCRVSSKGLNSLLESVRSLKSLEDIDLSFDPTDSVFENLKLSGEVLKPFFEGISGFKKLESLKIGMISCRDITDQDVQLLIQTFRQVSSLKNVNLEFKSTFTIDEDKQKTLKEGLQHMQSLHFLMGFEQRFGGFKDGKHYHTYGTQFVQII